MAIKHHACNMAIHCKAHKQISSLVCYNSLTYCRLNLMFSMYIFLKGGVDSDSDPECVIVTCTRVAGVIAGCSESVRRQAPACRSQNCNLTISLLCIRSDL